MWGSFLTLFTMTYLLLFSVKDIKTRIIPDKWILNATIITLVIRICYSPESFLNYAMASLCVGGIALIVAIFSNGGIGGGDIKLLAWLGLSMGLSISLTVTLLSSAVGIVYTLTTRRYSIPFAPCIFSGFIIYQGFLIIL